MLVTSEGIYNVFTIKGTGKIKATAIHFGISLLIFLALIALLLLYWFPGDFFAMAGGWQGIKIVAAVDLVLGPLLTFIVYKTGKKSLTFDLSVIACLQLAALGWGIHVMHEKHPSVIAYANNGFVVVSYRDMINNAKKLEKESLVPIDSSTLDPNKPAYVFVKPFGEKDYGKFLEGIFNGLPDAGGRSDRYINFTKGREEMKKHKLDLDAVKDETPNLYAALKSKLMTHKSPDHIEIHRVRTDFREGYALFDSKNSKIVGLITPPEK